MGSVAIHAGMGSVVQPGQKAMTLNPNLVCVACAVLRPWSNMEKLYTPGTGNRVEALPANPPSTDGSPRTPKAVLGRL